MSGILGQSAPLAATNTTIYTVPANTHVVANISIANRASTAVTVRIALAAAPTPTNAEFIEFDTTIPGFGVLERTGLSLQSGRLVVVFASNANTSVSLYGIVQSTV
jgi:hypothetical protein